MRISDWSSDVCSSDLPRRFWRRTSDRRCSVSAESTTAAVASPPLPASDRRPRRNELPAWFPPWALSLAELYFSGTTSVFVLHGNTYDLVPLADVDAAER